METQELLAPSPPIFGPPIFGVATEPADRPLALALVIDLSPSLYGTRRACELFKASLVARFSNMENDNVLLLAGETHENPGAAVAALHKHQTPGNRNLSAWVIQATTGLVAFDRFYRRRLVLLTDQFREVENLSLQKAVTQNGLRFHDIDFHAVGYGPKYSRKLAESGWAYRHLDEPAELDPVLTEVCK